MRLSLGTYDAKDLQQLLPLRRNTILYFIVIAAMSGLALVMLSAVPSEKSPALIFVAAAIAIPVIALELLRFVEHGMEYVYRNILGYAVWAFLDPKSSTDPNIREWKVFFTTDRPDAASDESLFPIVELRLGGWFRSQNGKVRSRGVNQPSFASIRVEHIGKTYISVKIKDREDGCILKFRDLYNFLVGMQIARNSRNFCDCFGSIFVNLTHSLDNARQAKEMAGAANVRQAKQTRELLDSLRKAEEETVHFGDLVDTLTDIILVGIIRLHRTKRLIKSAEGASTREELTKMLLTSLSRDTTRAEHVRKSLKEKGIPIPEEPAKAPAPAT